MQKQSVTKRNGTIVPTQNSEGESSKVLSVYERRILSQIVYYLKRLNDGVIEKGFAIKSDGARGKYVQLPLVAMMSGLEDRNQQRIKNGLNSLIQKGILYGDNFTLPKYTRIIEIGIPTEVHKALICYSLQIKNEYKLTKDLAFNKISYSLQFRTLLAEKTQPFTLSIPEIRDLFQLENKYEGNSSDIIRKVILPSKKMLDQSPNSTFTYSVIKDTKKKIVGFTITPVIRKCPLTEVTELPENQIHNNDIQTSITNKPKKRKLPNKNSKIEEAVIEPEKSPIQPTIEPESKVKGSWVKRVFKRLFWKKR